MKKLVLTTLFGALLAVSASAQTFSQPMREVEKPARSAVHGRCNLQIDPGYVGNMSTCGLFDATQSIGETVPSGKTLVIEDLAASCSKSNQDLTTSILLRHGTMWKPLPLQLVRTLSNGRQVWISSLAARMYVKAGDSVYISVDTGNNATQLTSCGVHFQGHLVNAQ